MRTAKSEALLTPAQRAAARLIVHLQASGPGRLYAAVRGDLITIRYDRRRPNVPAVWEGFLVETRPNFEHPDHGWEAFLRGEPGDGPAVPPERTRRGWDV